MMISETFQEDVFIADFTNYTNTPNALPVEFRGVVVGTEENGKIPSFVLTNKNKVPFVVVNNEKNPGFYTREDGRKVSQCECIVHSARNDNRKGWIVFVELKYCEAKNIYENMLDGISQLKSTCKYVLDEKREFDGRHFKSYLVISTPGIEPIDPFDAYYFDQDFILSIKEETGALLKATNVGHIRTPAVIDF